jgi:hypothetical protein
MTRSIARHHHSQSSSTSFFKILLFEECILLTSVVASMRISGPWRFVEQRITVADLHVNGKFLRSTSTKLSRADHVFQDNRRRWGMKIAKFSGHELDWNSSVRWLQQSSRHWISCVFVGFIHECCSNLTRETRKKNPEVVLRSYWARFVLCNGKFPFFVMKNARSPRYFLESDHPTNSECGWSKMQEIMFLRAKMG